MNHPLVSIIILTYNHEKYISQAIDSVLSQRVNFSYEIIVSNDCSTDSTDLVCKTYNQKYDVIHYHCHAQNMGLIKNHLWSVKQAKGKYIAYCDGDDYWIDQYKLQRQIDYMESHPNCVLGYHNVIVESGNNRSLFIPLEKYSGNIELREVLCKWAIPTSAIIYLRKALIDEVEDVIRFPNEDYALEIFLKSKGEYYYDASIAAVYRRHSSSVSAEMNNNVIKLYKDLVFLLHEAKKWFPTTQHHLFDETISKYQDNIHKAKRNIKYPFLKYLKRSTYKRWLISIVK